MHFFDPTVNWPSELINEEVPDLIYLKSNSPISLNVVSSSLALSDSLSDTVEWRQYASISQIAPFVTVLMLRPQTVQSRDEDYINALLSHLRSINVEVARYRRIAGSDAPRQGSHESSILPYLNVWSWRPPGSPERKPPGIESSSNVELLQLQAEVEQSQRRKCTAYRLIPCRRDQSPANASSLKFLMSEFLAMEPLQDLLFDFGQTFDMASAGGKVLLRAVNRVPPVMTTLEGNWDDIVSLPSGSTQYFP